MAKHLQCLMYIIENFHLKHDVQLVNQFNFGSIEEKENSITKNLIDKYD